MDSYHSQIIETNAYFGMENMLFLHGKTGGFPSEAAFVAREANTKILAVHV
jgi:hypothetical protein